MFISCWPEFLFGPRINFSQVRLVDLLLEHSFGDWNKVSHCSMGKLPLCKWDTQVSCLKFFYGNKKQISSHLGGELEREKKEGRRKEEKGKGKRSIFNELNCAREAQLSFFLFLHLLNLKTILHVLLLN